MARTRAGAGAEVVQKLLEEVRDLKVQRERLRLELRELEQRSGSPDPRVRSLENEIKRLRDELAAARAERDQLKDGVAEAIGRLARM